MLPGRLITRRWRRRALVGVPALLVCGYFAYHAVYGEAGYAAWRELRVERDRVETALARVQASNASLEVAIRGLRPETLAPDAVETALRELGYVRPGERVILEPRARH